jgi:acyl-CoA hydrolase
MNTVFETNFVVMPTDANYMYPMIFGGAFFAQMDLCAARTVQRLLYDSECDGAVTHRVDNLQWFKPCYVGDLIFLRGEVIRLRDKFIVVSVHAQREIKERREDVALGEFTFVSIKKGDMSSKPNLLDYREHKLKMPPTLEFVEAPF